MEQQVTLVRQALYEQYHAWRGTRYHIGGLSNQGIDCSGFMYVTFKNRFGVTLPRSTDGQARLGVAIARQDLQAGDLVFFKTGKQIRHVGVYLENNLFMHASTRHGVMISDLTDKYWRKTWWMARRIES